MRRTFLDTIRSTLEGWRARRAQDRALRTALARFAALHPDWYASCFDETFVRRIGPDAMLTESPVDVARSWTLQFRYAEERARECDVRQLVPVVESFVTLLRGVLDETRPATPRSAAAGARRADGLATEGCT